MHTASFEPTISLFIFVVSAYRNYVFFFFFGNYLKHVMYLWLLLLTRQTLAPLKTKCSSTLCVKIRLIPYRRGGYFVHWSSGCWANRIKHRNYLWLLLSVRPLACCSWFIHHIHSNTIHDILFASWMCGTWFCEKHNRFTFQLPPKQVLHVLPSHSTQ